MLDFLDHVGSTLGIGSSLVGEGAALQASATEDSRNPKRASERIDQSYAAVFVERSDRKTDQQVKAYFDELKGAGHPFDPSNASKYAPLASTELANTLHDFKMKKKSSPMMQIADLYLYPICQGGYKANYYPFVKLEEASRLIDVHVEDVNTMGIKYYCFEGIAK